jgi:hypothetical protein
VANKTVTVRPSGGTYTTLAAAIAGELTANANLTAAGMNGILTIQIEGDWSGGPDTTAVDISGFTVDSTHYLKVITDSANKAGAVWSDSKYRLNVSAGWTFAFRCQNDYTQIIGIQCRNTHANAAYGMVQQNQYVVFDGCLVYNIAVSNGAILGFTNALVRNCIVSKITGVGILAGGVSSNSLYNNTVTNCSGVGIQCSAISTAIKNCYSGGNTGADYAGSSITWTTSYSEDDTGTTDVVAYSTDTFTNVTSGSENLSLVAGSGLIGVGTDLRADAVWPFNYDIMGTTRGTTWDVGAFEYVATSNDCVGSGTLTLSGNATISEVLSFTGSGTLNLSGSAITNESLSFIGSGNLNLSGSSTTKEVLSKTGIGTLTFSGSSTTKETLSCIASGILNLSGSATTSYSTASIFNCIGSGTLSLSGSAIASSGLSFTGSGILNLSGSSVTKEVLSNIGSGTLTLSGSSASKIIISCLANGSLSFSGSSSNNLTDSFIGSGTLGFGGSGTNKIVLSDIGNGNLSLSGSATTNYTYIAIYSFIGSGTITFSGGETSARAIGYCYLVINQFKPSTGYSVKYPIVSGDRLHPLVEVV